MWKSLLLGLLVSLHTRIFLVFMRNYEAKSPLFMIKRAGLNYVPRQSYSKNSHGSYILKWILVHFIYSNNLKQRMKYKRVRFTSPTKF